MRLQGLVSVGNELDSVAQGKSQLLLESLLGMEGARQGFSRPGSLPSSTSDTGALIPHPVPPTLWLRTWEKLLLSRFPGQWAATLQPQKESPIVSQMGKLRPWQGLGSSAMLIFFSHSSE